MCRTRMAAPTGSGHADGSPVFISASDHVCCCINPLARIFLGMDVDHDRGAGDAVWF